MSKISEYMLTDIEKNTVDFMPTMMIDYKNQLFCQQEYQHYLQMVLQALPVGMATNIPPHNLTELIDGIIKIIDEDNVTDEELMSIIKGPDFPTEGIIFRTWKVSNKHIQQVKEKITLRAETEIEEMSGNRQRIIVSSLPYQVNKANLIKNISDLSKERKVEGISECRDESDRKDRVRVVIELKRDAKPTSCIKPIFKTYTNANNFWYYNACTSKWSSKNFNIKTMFRLLYRSQKRCYFKRTQFELDKALARAHILEGLKIALDNID